MRRWYIALAFLLILLHPFTVAAHSGGTDSHGGHHDGDDYHYHHGYPAHDHWDMDGDGDLDCPYNFDDKTDQNSGSSSGGSGSILKPKPTEPPKTHPPTSQDGKTFDPDELMNDASKYWAAGIGIAMVLAIIISCINKRVADLCVCLVCILFSLAMIFYGVLVILGWFL